MGYAAPWNIHRYSICSMSRLLRWETDENAFVYTCKPHDFHIYIYIYSPPEGADCHSQGLMTMPKHVDSRRFQQGEKTIHFPVTFPWAHEVLVLGWLDGFEYPGQPEAFDFLEVFAGRQALTRTMPSPQVTHCHLVQLLHPAGLGTKLATGAHPTTRPFMDVLWNLLLPQGGCL